MLRENPGLTSVIVLSLAIGIGANTAVFSVAGALLLRPLPYPQPDRLAILWLRSPGIGILQDWPSPGQYIDIQTQNHVFEETTIAIGNTFTLLGRLLGPEDDKPGGCGGLASRLLRLSTAIMGTG